MTRTQFQMLEDDMGDDCYATDTAEKRDDYISEETVEQAIESLHETMERESFSLWFLPSALL